MFEHHEGHPAPPGAGIASRLPRRHSSLALPITDGAFSRLVNNEMRLRARLRPGRRCLSIVRVTRHHPVLGRSLVCRAATVVLLYTLLITHTGATVSRLVNIEMRLRARLRPDRRCLSIVRVTRHHPVLG